MKTQNISKQRTWRQLNANLEVWECVATKDVRDLDAKSLAFIAEFVRPSDRRSIFMYEVGKAVGIEWKRSDAMKKAEGFIKA